MSLIPFINFYWFIWQTRLPKSLLCTIHVVTLIHLHELMVRFFYADEWTWLQYYWHVCVIVLGIILRTLVPWSAMSRCRYKKTPMIWRLTLEFLSCKFILYKQMYIHFIYLLAILVRQFFINVFPFISILHQNKTMRK